MDALASGVLMLLFLLPIVPFGVVAGAAFVGDLPHAAAAQLALACYLQGALGDRYALAELGRDRLGHFGEPSRHQRIASERLNSPPDCTKAWRRGISRRVAPGKPSLRRVPVVAGGILVGKKTLTGAAPGGVTVTRALLRHQVDRQRVPPPGTSAGAADIVM